MSTSGRILVYGGRGALGTECVKFFKSKKYWVGSVEIVENKTADENILVLPDASFKDQEGKVHEELSRMLKIDKLDAVLCVAGGFLKGNAQKDLAANVDLMFRQSVWSSVISTSLATKYLKEGGLLTLPGAKDGLKPSSAQIGYNVAKAAVHHLTKSLASAKSGLPYNALAVAILPETLDTEANRKWMPYGDRTQWTPLSYVTHLFWEWTIGQDRPNNGSLCQLVTKNKKTYLVLH